MIYRVCWTFAVIIFASAAIAADLRPNIAQQLQPPGICWAPDVEFPVPCEDDDD